MKETQQQVRFVEAKPVSPCQNLEIPEHAAFRLGRLLKRLSQDMVTLEEEEDSEFAIVWSQLFTNYGMAKMCEGFMLDSDPFRSQAAKYMGVTK